MEGDYSSVKINNLTLFWSNVNTQFLLAGPWYLHNVQQE